MEHSKKIKIWVIVLVSTLAIAGGLAIIMSQKTALFKGEIGGEPQQPDCDNRKNDILNSLKSGKMNYDNQVAQGIINLLNQTYHCGWTEATFINPAAAIMSPAEGTNVLGTTTITAEATPGNDTDEHQIIKVEFYVDDEYKGIDTDAPYEYEWNTKYSQNGQHIIHVTAYDSMSWTNSANRAVTVANMRITAPAEGTTIVSGTPQNITADIPQSLDVANIWIFVNGDEEARNQRIDTPYQWDTTGLAAGQYTITVVGFGRVPTRDSGFRIERIPGAEAEVNVTIQAPAPPQNQKPTVSITNPVAGEVSGTVPIRANASDDTGVDRVLFYLDGARGQLTTINRAPYEYEWDTRPVTNGEHTLTAVAYDAQGSFTISEEVRVTVHNEQVIAGLQGGFAPLGFNGGVGLNFEQVGIEGGAGLGFEQVGIQGGALEGVEQGEVGQVGQVGQIGEVRQVVVGGCGGIGNPAQCVDQCMWAGGVCVDNPNFVVVGNEGSDFQTLCESQPGGAGEWVLAENACNYNNQLLHSIDELKAKIGPTVTINVPVLNATVGGAAVSITATIVDSVGSTDAKRGIDHVVFRIDNNQVSSQPGKANSSEYTYSWNTTQLAEGSSHTILVVAFDKEGVNSNGRYGQVTVTVRNQQACPAERPLNWREQCYTRNDLCSLFTQTIQQRHQSGEWDEAQVRLQIDGINQGYQCGFTYENVINPQHIPPELRPQITISLSAASPAAGSAIPADSDLAEVARLTFTSDHRAEIRHITIRAKGIADGLLPSKIDKVQLFSKVGANNPDQRSERVNFADGKAEFDINWIMEEVQPIQDLIIKAKLKPDAENGKHFALGLSVAGDVSIEAGDIAPNQIFPVWGNELIVGVQERRGNCEEGQIAYQTGCFASQDALCTAIKQLTFDQLKNGSTTIAAITQEAITAVNQESHCTFTQADLIGPYQLNVECLSSGGVMDGMVACVINGNRFASVAELNVYKECRSRDQNAFEWNDVGKVCQAKGTSDQFSAECLSSGGTMEGGVCVLGGSRFISINELNTYKDCRSRDQNLFEWDTALKICRQKSAVPYITCEQRGLYTYNDACIQCPVATYVQNGGSCAAQYVNQGENSIAAAEDAAAAAEAAAQAAAEAAQAAAEAAAAALQRAQAGGAVGAAGGNGITLQSSMRLASAPERGNTGPEMALYFALVGAVQAVLWIRKKRK